MKVRKPRSTRLTVEALEQRDTPSVTSVVANNYMVSINCNSNPSNVSVQTTDIEFGDGSPGSQDLYLVNVKDTTNGFNKSYWVKNSAASKIVFNGGAGNDIFKCTTEFACTIKGNGGNDTLGGGPKGDTIYGGSGNDLVSGNAGNDLLYGDSGNDTINGGLGIDKLYGGIGDDTLNGQGSGDYLYGESGADKLFGGEGNDNLYGGYGSDKLYGEAGSDFLDDGSNSTEGNFGGDGHDFLAYKPVDTSTTGSDINQGSQNTCWILSPLASAANAGMTLKNRIIYNGNGDYSVKLYSPTTKLPFYVHVSLQGGMYGFEPTPVGPESWVILFQRAILKQFTSNIADPSTYPWFATSPSQSMPYITGRSASFDLAGGTYLGSFGLGDLQKVKNALAAGKLACVGSRQGDYGDALPGVVSVASPYICGGHVYSVISVDMANQRIKLRNPWGTDVSTDVDGNVLHNMVAQGVNEDGIIELSFNQFIGSFAMMSIS